SRSSLSRTSLSPKPTVMPRADSTTARGFACVSVLASDKPGTSEVDGRVEHGEQPVHEDDDEDGLDHRGGYLAAERFRAAADLEAFDGGDDADDHRHERRLQHARDHGREVDCLLQPRLEDVEGDAGIEVGDHGRPAE